ncbi:hypothetical protein PYCC9005_002829 [Savitreella phatthalungensis]
MGQDVDVDVDIDVVQSNRESWLRRLRGNPAFIVHCVGFAIFTDLFLYGIIVPVLPYALTPRFNIPEDQVQIKVSGLLAAYAAGLFTACPVVGWWSDRVSARRTPLLAGLVVLAATTLMLMLARVFWLLVVARLLQGMSAAVVWTVGMALLGDTVGTHAIGAAMGVVSIYLGCGIFAGPILGGILYRAGGYYPPYALALAVLAIDIVWRLAIIERPRHRHQTPTSSTSTGHPATDNGTPLWTSRLPAIIRILSFPRVLAGCWLGFICAAVLSCFDSVLPLHLEEIFGFDSLAAGLVFGALVLPSFVVSPLAGWWLDRRGTKLITLVGCTLQVPFLILLRLPTSARPRTPQVVLMCALLALNGVAAALALPASLAEITLCVTEAEDRHPGSFGARGALASGYALYNVMYAVGSFVGPLVAGAVRDAAGWKTMAWVMALLEAIGLPIIVLYLGGPLRGGRKVWLGPVDNKPAAVPATHANDQIAPYPTSTHVQEQEQQHEHETIEKSKPAPVAVASAI